MDTNTALQQATGAGDNVGNLLQQEKTTLDPLHAKAESAMSQQIPKPDLKKAPDAPDGDLREGATQWMATLSVLSGLGGAISRQHATLGLDAFAAGLNGFTKGKMDAFKQSKEQWTEANKAVIENNKAQLDEYKAALADKKLSIDEQMSEIKTTAAQYHNDVMAQAAEQRNFTLVARTVDMIQANNDKLDLQTKALDTKITQIQSRVEGLKTASEVYKTMYPVDASGARAKEYPGGFTAWLSKEWPKVKNEQMGGGEGGGEGDDGTAGGPPEVPQAGAASAAPGGKSPNPPPAGQRVTIYKDGKPAGTVPMEQAHDAELQGYTLKAQ